MTLGAGLVSLIEGTSHLTDPLLPTGGSQALCQVDAEAHLDSVTPPPLIGLPRKMDVVTKGNDAAIGCWEVSANTTLFVGEVRVEAPGKRRAGVQHGETEHRDQQSNCKRQ
ncbi:hypothetical protein CgunFtcFv8_019994 [Champsocephalus gunnari]|uniref:Uncharacterized protein n=1 Tax=Champsocephalus gunnari TaxID=52237 RepID=A0AAN8DKP5_CHAGU|nr:hypothetical protein CgunFtcFv8_019994 [Champsocephalus gunnari]